MTAPERRRRDRDRQGLPLGFTLLEVLLATMISASLLALLWALFSVYLRLFETGPARAEQVQLARALLQQLGDDLHSAIEDAPKDDPAAESPGAAGPAAAVRRFGLLGTRDALRVDVLQMIPMEESPSLRGDVTDALRGVTVRQVPELRTIFYSFRKPGVLETADPSDPAVAPAAGLAARPGLTRRELDYETPYTQLEDSLAAGRVPTVAALDGEFVDEMAPTDSWADALPGDAPQGESITWAPEVVGLEFRYFDGSGFSSEWNSLKRKSLPVAIEVTLQLSTPEQAKPRRPSADEVSPDENGPDLGTTLDGLDKGLLQPEEIPSTIYSLLIDLPSAKHHPTLRPPARSRTPFGRRGPRVSQGHLTAGGPLAVPRPLTVKRPGGASASPRKPDQWMRTGP